jgi:hypothetical protein
LAEKEWHVARQPVDDPSAAFLYEPEQDAASRSEMTIREVEAWVIRSPHPAVDIGGGHSTKLLPDSVLVRITTDGGYEGFGDSWVQHTDARILRTGVLLGLRPLLLGQDSRHIPKLWDRLWRSVRHHGLHPAVSAVDIALWDLKARAMGQPVWQLLGGLLRDRVEAYATIPWNRPAEEQLELIDAAGEWGFRGVKFAIGHGVETDKARITRLRSERPDMPRWTPTAPTTSRTRWRWAPPATPWACAGSRSPARTPMSRRSRPSRPGWRPRSPASSPTPPCTRCGGT